MAKLTLKTREEKSVNLVDTEKALSLLDNKLLKPVTKIAVDKSYSYQDMDISIRFNTSKVKFEETTKSFIFSDVSLIVDNEKVMTTMVLTGLDYANKSSWELSDYDLTKQNDVKMLFCTPNKAIYQQIWYAFNFNKFTKKQQSLFFFDKAKELVLKTNKFELGKAYN